MKKAKPGMSNVVAFSRRVSRRPVQHNSSGTPVYETYDERWQTRNYDCPKCAWNGSYDELDGPEIYGETTEYCCPVCFEGLLIIIHPTYRETFVAAAQGNEDAIRELGFWREISENWKDPKRRLEEYNQRIRDMRDKAEGPK